MHDFIPGHLARGGTLEFRMKSAHKCRGCGIQGFVGPRNALWCQECREGVKKEEYQRWLRANKRESQRKSIEKKRKECMNAPADKDGDQGAGKGPRGVR